MNRSLVAWLAVFSFLILFFFSLATHPFEVPDEQAHYATVHYLIHEGRLPSLADRQDLSLEETETEKLLGVMSEGQNRYSYHPEYRLLPGNGTVGLYEDEIKSYNSPEFRRTYTIHQAAIYPPLYYLYSSPWYAAVNRSDILQRLFAVRLGSVILTSALIVLAYLTGRVLFRGIQPALALAVMVLLFPMTTYLGSGVNSDNLHNLLFTAFLYLCYLQLKSGWETKRTLSLSFVFVADYLTKPQAVIMIPIFLLSLLLGSSRSRGRAPIKPILISASLAVMAVFLYRQPQYLDTGRGFSAVQVFYGGWDNFLAFVKHYRDLAGPLLVWYWGVFKWFGLVLPRPFWWLANRLIAVAAVGILLQLWRQWRPLSLTAKFILFSIFANVMYVAAILWFDWQFYQQIGRSLGVQPRYFLPLIVSQLFLLYLGLTGWITSSRWRNLAHLGIVILFLSLHLAGLYTQLAGYYELSSWPVFLNQFSQYKPWYAKGSWWYLWISLYLLGMIGSLKLTLKKYG